MESFPFNTLEELLCSEEGFGLTTATPLQRAICRIIEGRPLGQYQLHEDVVAALATDEELPAGRPREVIILAAIRCAKSLIDAATAIMASQTCTIDQVTGGEVPRYPVLSLQKDNAAVVLAHLRGVLAKPALAGIQFSKEEYEHWKDIVMRDVSGGLVGSEVLKHPTGHAMEIRVVAGKRAGGSLISRWLFGMCFDEAPRMLGQDDGVVNYDDAREAVLGRLLPGAQILSIGSPWASFGPMFDAVQNEWGRPTAKRVVIKAPGPAMNPFWWTPERCQEVKESDATAYQTNVLAEFADVSETIYPQALLDECSRDDDSPIPYERGHEYVAAMDPATRGNAWTLVVADCVRRTLRPTSKDELPQSKLIKRIVFRAQWEGNQITPLRPKEVLTDVNNILSSYALDWCYTDQWAADALKDIAQGMGLSLIDEAWTQANKVDAFLGLQNMMADGQIELPKCSILHKDLKLTKKKPTQASLSIVFTKTGTRHCDFSPTVAKVFSRWIQEDQVLDPRPGESGYNAFQEDQMMNKMIAEVQQQGDSSWWEFEPYSM